jgi:ceramide glucosyltransferase
MMMFWFCREVPYPSPNLSSYDDVLVLQGGPLPFSKFEFLVAWLLRELLSPYVLLNSHRNRNVTWRNRKYRLKWGGLVEDPDTPTNSKPPLPPDNVSVV